MVGVYPTMVATASSSQYDGRPSIQGAGEEDGVQRQET